MNEQQKYQKRNLLLFPLGTVGRDAVYALINSFLLTFVLFTRSLNAAQLTAITAIMVAARIFDTRSWEASSNTPIPVSANLNPG